MSLVSSSAAASATGTCSGVSYSEFPTKDAGCAVAVQTSPSGLPDNYKDSMKDCCKDASVEKWADDCGLYCLSIGQSIADLTQCFQDAGIKPRDIFCNSNNTATATATSGADTTSNPATSGTAGNTAESSGAASAGMVPQQGVSKAGLGIFAMLFVSAAFGALL